MSRHCRGLGVNLTLDLVTLLPPLPKLPLSCPWAWVSSCSGVGLSLPVNLRPREVGQTDSWRWAQGYLDREFQGPRVR